MTFNPNVYSQLLLFSLICGSALRVLSDLLRLIQALFFYKTQYNSLNKTDGNKDITTQGLLCQKETDILNCAFALYPHKKSRAETVFTAVCDVIFALLSSVTVILLINHFNRGELRGFVLPTMAIGYLLYALTLSKPTYRIAFATASRIIRLLSVALRIVISPLKKLLRLLFGALAGVVKAVRQKKKSKAARRAAATNDE